LAPRLTRSREANLRRRRYGEPAGVVAISHTYSAYSRGVDILNSAYSYIDLTPKGRDEAGHDNPQFWVRHHDEYDR
jgi:predicted dithiol-disulfide oxidoreductase (DUF899 family)